jgi:hypothetical protein
VRVGIYGSCVTRDAFALVEHPFEIARYVARTSWISQTARAPRIDPEWVGARLSPFKRRSIAIDIEKRAVEELAAGKPDIVLIDLIDERLPVETFSDGSAVTLSGYFLRAPRALPALVRGRVLRARGSERLARFAEAVGILAPRITDVVPAERILLHRSMFTDRVMGGARTHVRRTAAMNAVLEPMYDAVQRALGCDAISPPPEVCLTDPGHRWGPSPFHYVQGYYEALINGTRAFAARIRTAQ